MLRVRGRSKNSLEAEERCLWLHCWGTAHRLTTKHPTLSSSCPPPPWAGVDWRQKLENQRGAVLATELKNNANKIAKWTAAALVA